MKRMVEKMMACHGRPITVERNGARQQVRAFLQPVNANVERLSLPQMGPLGRESRERFLYIGPAAPELRVDDRLEVRGTGYLVRSAQQVFDGEQALYCWAMCVKEGGEGSWNG